MKKISVFDFLVPQHNNLNKWRLLIVFFFVSFALCGEQRVLGQQQQPELTNNFHSAILCTDGTVQTVGYNSFGQLGIGSTTPATTNLFTMPNQTIKVKIPLNPQKVL